MRQNKDQFIRYYRHSPYCNNPDEIRMIALNSALKAATMRNKTYAANVANERKNEFRAAWKSLIVDLGDKYFSRQQTIETFIQDVVYMRDILNEQFGDILCVECIRIGHCQKALSIYLKWMWCYYDTMPVPPMCAIDSRILNHSGIIGRYTRLNDVDLYRQWIGGILEVSRRECLQPINGVICHNVVEWELVVFNRINAQ